MYKNSDKWQETRGKSLDPVSLFLLSEEQNLLKYFLFFRKPQQLFSIIFVLFSA